MNVSVKKKEKKEIFDLSLLANQTFKFYSFQTDFEPWRISHPFCPSKIHVTTI